MPDVSAEGVLEAMQPIFAEALDTPRVKITMQSNARNTPSWDSLAHIELIEMIERHFKVRFALGELQDLKEAGDLVRLVVAKTNKA